MAIVQVNFFSESLLRTVNITAVIPVDKRSVDGEQLRDISKPMKTLYLLHGIYSGEWDWLTTTRVKKFAMDRNLAVIMPSGENSFYNDIPEMHALYSKFIGEELLAFTRTLFRLSDKREDTFIGGLSMGGMGAIYAALRYPENFSHAGGLSTALLADDYPKTDDYSVGLLSSRTFYEKVFAPKDKFRGSDRDYDKLAADLAKSGRPLPKIFMACGKDDPLLGMSRRYQKYLKDLGYDVDYFEDTGAHDWAFWDRNLHRYIETLPVEKQPAKRIFDF